MVGIQKDRHAKAAQGDGAYVWTTARVPWLGGPPKRKLCNKLYTIQKTHIRNKNNVWARKAFLAWKAIRNFIGKKKQRALLIRAGCNGKKQEESLPPLKTTDILLKIINRFSHNIRNAGLHVPVGRPGISLLQGFQPMWEPGRREAMLCGYAWGLCPAQWGMENSTVY